MKEIKITYSGMEQVLNALKAVVHSDYFSAYRLNTLLAGASEDQSVSGYSPEKNKWVTLEEAVPSINGLLLKIEGALENSKTHLNGIPDAIFLGLYAGPELVSRFGFEKSRAEDIVLGLTAFVRSNDNINDSRGSNPVCSPYTLTIGITGTDKLNYTVNNVGITMREVQLYNGWVERVEEELKNIMPAVPAQ